MQRFENDIMMNFQQSIRRRGRQDEHGKSQNAVPYSSNDPIKTRGDDRKNDMILSQNMWDYE